MSALTPSSRTRRRGTWLLLGALLGPLLAGLALVSAPVSYTHLTLPTIYSV